MCAESVPEPRRRNDCHQGRQLRDLKPDRRNESRGRQLLRGLDPTVGRPQRRVDSLPAFYSLHVWAREHNPAGRFEMWNPDVVCP
jgi:hypothetical protein